MAKANFASDSGGTTAYNTIFVDTSLDTHLATIVSDSETVADLKKKILYEHPLCFPDIREIKIHALKVKRRGFFYHLSDSMFVKSAFDGVSKSWFLSVDASRMEKHGENQDSRKSNSGNLLAIMNKPSAEGVDLLLDGPLERLSNVDDSSELQVEINQHVKQKHIADQFGPGDSNGEVLKDLEMEVDHTAYNCSKVASPKTNRRSKPELQEKSNLYNKEFEDPGTHAGRKEDSSGNGIMDVQCNNSLEGAPTTQSVAKKKGKTKKKNEDAVHDHVLKENDASVCGSGKAASQPETLVRENSLGNAGRVVSYDVEIGNKSIDEEPYRSSSSDFNNRLGTGVQMTNVSYEGTEVIGRHVDHESNKSKSDVVNVQSNRSLEESSHSGPAAKRKCAEEKDGSENSSMENRSLFSRDSVKSQEESLHSGHPAKKKRKTEKKDGNEKSSKENRGLIYDSVKETSRPEITNCDYSLGDKQRSPSSALDGLSTAPLEDNQMLRTSSISEKRKRKKKSSDPLDQGVAAVPSSRKDVRGKSSGATVGINPKDSGTEPDTALVAGQSAQGALISEPKEKLCDPVQEVGGLDIDMSDTDVGKMESRNDTPELAAASAESRVTILKDHLAIDVEGHPAIVVQEPKNLKKDVSISRHENTILDNSNRFGTDQTFSVEEERELSRNNDLKATEAVIASNLLDANGILESKNSSKKRRKSRKTQDPDGGEPVASGTDHVNSSVTGNSSNEPHEAVNSDHVSEKAKKEESIVCPTEGKDASKIKTVSTSLPATDRQTGDVIQNVLESLQQVSEKPVDAENMDEKSTKKKKKKKKKQSSTEKNHPELQTNNEDSLKNLKLSTDPMREVDVSSTLTKKTESGTDQVKDSVTGNSPTEPHEAVNSDRVSEKARKEESVVCPTEGKEASKIKPVSTSLLATDRETDDVIRNVLESLQQVNENPVNAENMDEKSRKKKKKRSSTEKNHPELLTNDVDISRKPQKLSTDPMREVDAPSTLTNKTESVKISSINQLNGSNLEPSNTTGVEIDPVHSQLNSKIDDSSQVLAYTLEGNHEGRPLHDVVHGNPCKSGHTDEAIDRMINFKDYFVPSQHQNEIADSSEVFVEKVTKAKGADNELKAKKKRKKLDINSTGPSPDLQSSLKLVENQGNGGEAQAGNSSSIQLQKSLSKDDGNNLMLHANKKLPKVSESGLKAPQSIKSDKFNSITEEAWRPNVVIAFETRTRSKKNKEAVSNSTVESSKNIINQNRRGDVRQSHLDRNHAASRKASGNNTGKVVNSSEHKKSLLATSGTIFNDSNGSSEDEDGIDNSDASTRTPSDDSMSSDYSDGESDANFISPQNGSYSSKGKGGGRKNITKSYSPGPKSVSLDTILKSSSRYKKAKLTASQHENTESQPVEYVPDSQPNF